MKKLLMIMALIIAGGSVSVADTFSIDGGHSDVGFSVRHLGVSKARGQFKDVSGEIVWNGKKELKTASFEGTVQVKSLDTQNEKREEHLLSADFFNEKAYPVIRFKSTKVHKKLGRLYAKGELPIHGIIKDVRIPIQVLGPAKDPWGNEKLGVAGTLTIDRATLD